MDKTKIMGFHQPPHHNLWRPPYPNHTPKFHLIYVKRCVKDVKTITLKLFAQFIGGKTLLSNNLRGVATTPLWRTRVNYKKKTGFSFPWKKVWYFQFFFIIFVSWKYSRDQKLKNHFPEENFSIKFEVVEHKFIYIAEIKFDKNIPFKNGSQTLFCHNLMLICAN